MGANFPGRRVGGIGAGGGGIGCLGAGGDGVGCCWRLRWRSHSKPPTSSPKPTTSRIWSEGTVEIVCLGAFLTPRSCTVILVVSERTKGSAKTSFRLPVGKGSGNTCSRSPPHRVTETTKVASTDGPLFWTAIFRGKQLKEGTVVPKRGRTSISTNLCCAPAKAVSPNTETASSQHRTAKHRLSPQLSALPILSWFVSYWLESQQGDRSKVVAQSKSPQALPPSERIALESISWRTEKTKTNQLGASRDYDMVLVLRVSRCKRSEGQQFAFVPLTRAKG